MADSKDEDEKKFKVVDVTPEDIEDGNPDGGRAHSAWGVHQDTWPGSSARTDRGGRAQPSWNGMDLWPGSSAVQVSGDELIITTTTTVRIPRGRLSRQSAWLAADTWPGSSASATEGPQGNRQSAWLAADTWPGSSAPASERPQGETEVPAKNQNDRRPVGPTDSEPNK
jgi:hypothetical protein